MHGRFPDVIGSSLAGTPHHLPGSLEGRLNLLLVAFRQWQQKDVDTWVPLGEELADSIEGFRVYELPVIPQAYRPVSGFIDGGMRGGIPDLDVRAATITLYINRRQFLEDLEIPDVRSIVPMLVVPSGEILWRASGRLTPDAEAELRAVVAE